MTAKDLHKVFYKQDELNSIVDGDNWILKNNDWVTAVIIESAELIDSLNWKWWKKGKDDIENAKMEVTDIFFFSISMMIEKRNKYSIKEEDTLNLKLPLTDKVFLDYKERIGVALERKSIIKHTKELIKAIQNFEDKANLFTEEEKELQTVNKYHDKIDELTKRVMKAIMNVAMSLNMSNEDLLKMYYAKLVLNKFRQNNGYKDGSYVKFIDGKEDNECLLELASNVPFDGNFENTLYNTFDAFYREHTK